MIGGGSLRGFSRSPELRRMPAVVGVGVLAALLLGPAAVLGAGPIRGAFGVELGEPIAGTATLDEMGAGPSRDSLGFTPAETASGFDEYVLEATPVTRAVYVVAGRGTVASLSRCLKTRARIAKEMARRHGVPESSDNSITAVFGQDPSLVGRQGDRTIRVECDAGPEGSRITLEYRDESVEALARRERESLEREKRLTASAE